MYKAVINDNYLCHYNQNHSKKNGQFVSGDGDGDGITNDHANQNKKKSGWKNMSKGKKALAITGLAVGTAGLVVGSIGLAKEFSKANMSKKLNDATRNGFAGQKFSKDNFNLKLNNVPLLESTAWTQQKLHTDWGNLTRKQIFEAPKAWGIGVHTTGYGGDDTRIFNTNKPYKGSWGKNRTWGWDK